MDFLTEATFWRLLAAAGIFLVGLIYIRGWRRLQAFHKGEPPRDAPASMRSLRFFMAGLGLLAVAFISPLGYLSTQYFSARIVQHMLLVASIPSLLMFADPVPALLHGLPEQWRAALSAAGKSPQQYSAGRRFVRWATAPNITLLTFLSVCWLWYDPTIHAATLRYSVVHAVELLSLLSIALLNWWHITNAWPHTHGKMPPFVRVLYTFISIWPIKIIGLILLFLQHPLYQYPASFQFRGLQLKDYIFGGIIAWIVSGLAYVIASIALVNEWLSSEIDKPTLPESQWATDDAMLAPGIKR